jgi:hypothetical protein
MIPSRDPLLLAALRLSGVWLAWPAGVPVMLFPDRRLDAHQQWLPWGELACRHRADANPKKTAADATA